MKLVSEFNMRDSFFLLVIFGTVITQCMGEEDTFLRFYNRSIENYIELPLENCTDIFATKWYDKSKHTVVFTHGFTGRPNGPAVTAVINAYLENGKYNVILLNWEYLASLKQQNIAGSYLNWAAPNARKLGGKFASVLKDMLDSGLDLKLLHLVGHSLGAQIFGIAGNLLAEKQIIFPRITGLDPASVGFENKPPPAKLNANSALFVDIIHSDPSKYGYKRSHGTVDFWPNYNTRGQVRQPGCDSKTGPAFTPAVRNIRRIGKADEKPRPPRRVMDLCNHNRSWQLWIDALKYQGKILGSYAKNYRTWKNYSTSERNATTLSVGMNVNNATPGDYYFVTTGSSPYGLGEDGL